MEKGPALVVIEGGGLGSLFPITEAGACIGRDATNEIVVAESDVSRQHARVVLHNGMVWVQDMGSRNGVFVNNTRVPDHRTLKPGDKLKVGNTVFEVVLDGAVARPKPPPPPPPAPAVPVGFVVGGLVAALVALIVALVLFI